MSYNSMTGSESKLKAVLGIIISPGEIIKGQMSKVPWPFALGISGLSFMLFFLQTGMDMMRAGSLEPKMVVVMAMLGLVYGTLGISLLAVLVWLFTMSAKKQLTIGWAISSFALGYAPALVYSLTGLAFSLLLGWKTSVAFGVTGVLWALRPNMYAIRQMSGDKMAPSIILTTLCGAIILMGWAYLEKLAA